MCTVDSLHSALDARLFVISTCSMFIYNIIKFTFFSSSSFFFFFYFSIEFLIAQIINGKYVEGFYIYARQLDAEANDLYKMLTVLNGGGASTCTITGLKIYTRYEFFVVPFYKSVEGKPSNSRIARTLEDGKCQIAQLMTLDREKLCTFCVENQIS